jgi:hypothetical protein
VAPASAAVEAFVPEAHLGLLRADGVPKAVLQPGRYLLWQLAAKVTLDVVSLEPLRPGVPEGFWALVPSAQVQTVLVLPFGPAHWIRIDHVSDGEEVPRMGYSLLTSQEVGDWLNASPLRRIRKGRKILQRYSWE